MPILLGPYNAWCKIPYCLVRAEYAWCLYCLVHILPVTILPSDYSALPSSYTVWFLIGLVPILPCAYTA
jgi:hypothetical protein